MSKRVEQFERRRCITLAAAVLVTLSVAVVVVLSSQRRDATPSGPIRSLKSEAPPRLPGAVEFNLADLTEPLELTDTPMYWHIPKAAGTFMDAFFSECMHLVVADQVGGMFGHDQDESLKIIDENGGLRYVNVDTAHIPGLKKAKSLRLAESGLANVVISQYVVPVAEVFTPEYRGRMFAMFRHPVERAVSEFFYLQSATWEVNYSPEWKDMTLEQWAQSNHVSRNWVVRMLVNKLGGPIYEKDLDVAKEILRRKCLVGLVSRMAESAERFDQYFGFDDDDSGEKRKCWEFVLGNGETSNRHDHPKIIEGSKEWEMLRRINYFDMQLYEYAEGLFEEQQSLLNDDEDEST